MRPTRREFLAGGAGLAGRLALPIGVFAAIDRAAAERWIPPEPVAGRSYPERLEAAGSTGASIRG